MGEPVQLQAWIDVLDPWSYVVATRLDHLVEELGDRVVLEWRAFLRHPEKQDQDPDEFRKGTIEWMEPASAEPGLTFSLWATSDPPPSHSAPPLVALKVAALENPTLSDAYRRAVFEAFFTANRTISDSLVLIDLARQVGFHEDGFAMSLRGLYRDHLTQVLLDDHEARQRGIADCPAVVVGDVYLVKGPATLDQLKELVAKVERGEADDHGAAGPGPIAAAIQAAADAAGRDAGTSVGSSETPEAATPAEATLEEEAPGLRAVETEVEIEGRTFRFGPVLVEEPAAT